MIQLKRVFAGAVIALLTSATGLAQSEKFITVNGPDLAARQESAIHLGRAGTTRFWTAYSFDVKPGIAIDASRSQFGEQFSGTMRTWGQATISIGKSLGRTVETRDLAVFLLHDATTGDVVRAEVYNLERPREYSGFPVYWLGHARNEESLGLLRSLVASKASTRIAEQAVVAAGVHDDPRVGGILEDFVRQTSSAQVRSAAAFWLGQTDGELPFLSELVRNQREEMAVRVQAVSAIGMSRDSGALLALQSLYGELTSRELKRQIVSAAACGENKDAALNFLIAVAESEAEREVRKQAIFWIGQQASERSAGALKDVVEKDDDDTEVQKAAVFAISQRPAAEAVPLLIKVARTHPKPAVRKQAMFWLGQTGDERALAFFKELLTK